MFIIRTYHTIILMLVDYIQQFYNELRLKYKTIQDTAVSEKGFIWFRLSQEYFKIHFSKFLFCQMIRLHYVIYDCR